MKKRLAALVITAAMSMAFAAPAHATSGGPLPLLGLKPLVGKVLQLTPVIKCVAELNAVVVASANLQAAIALGETPEVIANLETVLTTAIDTLARCKAA